MQTIGISEARGNLAAVLSRVQDGKRPIVIERRGKALAALVSVEELALIERGRQAESEEVGSAQETSRSLFAKTERLARLGHWEWDEIENKCVYCSDELAQIHGVSVEEYLRQSSSYESDLLWAHPDDRERVDQIVQELTAQGKGFDIEYRLLRPDGVVLDVREVSETIHDDDGNLVRSVGFLQDITDRKRIERDLQQSESALARAQRQANVGSWRWDVAGKRLISCSQEFARIFGAAADQAANLLDPQFDRVVHPADRRRVEAALARSEETAEHYEIEYRIVRPDGETRHLIEIGETLCDDNGRAVEQFGTIQDVTARKQAEDDLRRAYEELDQRVRERTAELTESERSAKQTQALLSDAIEALNEGFAMFDHDDRLLLWNAKYREYFAALDDMIEPGVRFETLLLAAAERGLLVEPETELDDFLRQRIVGHRHGGAEYQILVAPDRWLWVRDHAAAGNRTISTFVDITELKRAELELQQSEARLSDAIENISEGFILFDADERLVLCNSKYREFLPMLDDILVPGARLEDLLHAAAERGQTAEAVGNEEAWIKRRLQHYRQGTGSHEHKLADGRWILATERRTTDGGIVGIRTDFTERRKAQEDLRASEEQLRLITDNLPVLISYVDREERFRFANKTCESWYARTAPDIVGKLAVEVHGDAYEHFRPHVAKALAGELVTYDHRIRYPDGNSRVVECTYVPHLDGTGGVLGFIALAHDISERERVQEALQVSEQRFRSVVENSPSVIFLKDRNGRFQMVNPRFEEWYGFSSDEVIGRTPRDIFPPTLSGDYMALDEEVLKTGEVREREFEVPFADGAMHWVKATKFPVVSRTGKISGVVSINTDITERKRAEAALRETETLLHSVIANSPAVIFVKDREGRLKLINPTFERELDVREAEVLGKTDKEYLPSVLADVFVAQDRRVLETGEVLDEEIDLQFEQGARTIHAVKFPLLDADGEIIGIGGITNDISQHRKVEEQLRQSQKMEAIGQLTGGLAHDFNNLLAIVTGHIELLERGLGDKEENIKVIKATSDRGARLIKRLLAFSRQHPLEQTATDLSALVTGMRDLLQRSLGENIEMEFCLEDRPWPVMADQTEVENALLNLVINARHAMPRGGRLLVEVLNISLDEDLAVNHVGGRSGAYVRLAVSDNGVGMSRDILDRAFEPFFTTREVGNGTGLGLSMVYGFAEQSGGYVTADSEEGVGTTVSIFLPRAEANLPIATSSQSEAEPTADGEVVLVVEDEAPVRSLVARILDDLGYEVLQAENGPSALSVLQRTQQIDLLLSDVVLSGGMSGPELARAAMQDRPGLKVLFMSGYAEKIMEQHGLPSGTTLLHKPFRRQDLAQKVSETICDHAAERLAAKQ